jgi:hypothetical protein
MKSRCLYHEDFVKISLAAEPVTHSAYAQDMPRLVRIILYFLAQMPDVRIHGSVKHMHIPTPNSVQNIIATENPKKSYAASPVKI